MRLKIISGGDSSNTRVVNAETGESVRGVVSVSWECRLDERAVARIEILGIEAELLAIEPTDLEDES